MSVEAWSFLVSRNPYLDYRTIVAPDFICAAGIPNLLARVADGELTEPGHAIRRKIEGSEVKEFTIVFRVIQALEKYINSEGGENLLKDSFGREIYLIEGLVIKGTGQVSITNEDLEDVHTQVRLSYQKFWDCIDVPPVESSSHFHLKIDEFSEASNLLELEEMQPLIVNSKKKAFQNSTWKFDQKLSLDFRISSIAFSPNENKIAIRGYNPFIEMRNLSNNKQIGSVNKRLMLVDDFDHDRAIAFSPNGKLIAFSTIEGADCNNILLWNVEAWQEESVFGGRPFVGSFSRIHAVSFSNDGKLLASASKDGTVKLWNTFTKEQYALLQHQNSVYTIAFSPTGSILASGDSKGHVELWDVKDKKRLDIFQSREFSLINSIAFNFNGSMLAVGGDGDWTEGKHLEIWDMSSKKIVHFLVGHSDPVNSVTFSPDGQILASGSKNGSVKLWDVNSGKEMLTISEQSNGDSLSEITSVAFSSDGRLLASSNMGGIVTIWRS